MRNICGSRFIKKTSVELIRKALKILSDIPSLSNREVARQLGVDEKLIRLWKKDPVWEQEKQKMEAEEKELFKVAIMGKKEDYKKELEEQHRNLKLLQKAFQANVAHSIKLSNNAYEKAGKEEDPLKGCTKATKAGVHYHSRNAMEALNKLIQINEQLYQGEILIEHLEKIAEEENSESPDSL